MKIDVDKIVTRILKEAFTTGPYNTTPDNNDLTAKGGTARQMLSGEWFGRPSWTFMQSSLADYQKAVAFQQNQSVEGQGDNVMMHGNPMEESLSDMFTNPNSLDYIVNSLEEVGYTKQAKDLVTIVENPTTDNIDFLINMTEALEADDAPEFITESLIALASYLVEGDADSEEVNDTEEPEDSDEGDGKSE